MLNPAEAKPHSLHFMCNMTIASSMEPNKMMREFSKVLDTNSCQDKLNMKW